MDLLAELTQQDLPQALLDSVRLLLEQADKSAQIIAHKDHVIKVADIKIAALALELAHHKRIRFANKSEAFTPTQNDLFEETWNTDLAAMEAEVEQQRLLLAAEASTSTINLNAYALAVSHYLHICHASSIVMNLSPATAVSVVWA